MSAAEPEQPTPYLGDVFYGSVWLDDWISTPTGVVKQLRGWVRILEDTALVGFRNRRGDSWVAVVADGPEDPWVSAGQVWVLMGCRVRSVARYPQGTPSLPDCYQLA